MQGLRAMDRAVRPCTRLVILKGRDIFRVHAWYGDVRHWRALSQCDVGRLDTRQLVHEGTCNNFRNILQACSCKIRSRPALPITMTVAARTVWTLANMLSRVLVITFVLRVFLWGMELFSVAVVRDAALTA